MRQVLLQAGFQDPHQERCHFMMNVNLYLTEGDGGGRGEESCQGRLHNLLLVAWKPQDKHDVVICNDMII